MTEGIRLPWPPSVNRYWRHARGMTYLTSEARRYREDVAECVRGVRYEGRLAVHITAIPPDRRRRDIDNVIKCTLDSLEHAGVFADDEQIDDLHIVRGEVAKPGCLDIVICVLP